MRYESLSQSWDIGDQRQSVLKNNASILYENLYNAASSIGVFKGLNKEERDIIGAAGLNQTTNALRADFVGGIHVKIF